MSRICRRIHRFASFLLLVLLALMTSRTLLATTRGDHPNLLAFKSEDGLYARYRGLNGSTLMLRNRENPVELKLIQHSYKAFDIKDISKPDASANFRFKTIESCYDELTLESRDENLGVGIRVKIRGDYSCIR
ncbi:hypothetical protein ACFL1X_13975, partial [Candidatus Hydrogenedentota bacterium]